MIFVTVGCSNFKFDRLFRIIDELCDENIICGDDIVAQTGKIDYKVKNYYNFMYGTHEEMESYQNKADYIICHAGTGTVIGALKKNKKVIVFPRLSAYNEHESDHQLDLCRSFNEKGFILWAQDKNSLQTCIFEIQNFVPNQFVSNKENFNILIKQLINK